jgi:sialate O-acetylesterase
MLLSTTLAAAGSARGAVALPKVFSDNMMLQCDLPAPVWGTAAPGEKVTVRAAGQEKAAVADRDGQWMIRLDPVRAGGPHDMVVSGQTNTVTFRNVLFGDVWLLSGQSNMAMALRDSDGGPDAARESGRYPWVRLNRSDEGWVVPDATNALNFSAVGYWFGLELHRSRKVPVGLLCRALGGRPAATFVRPEALAADPVLKAAVWDPYLRYKAGYADLKKAWETLPPDKRAKDLPPPEGTLGWPGEYWTALIAPIVPYGLKGALWYQGESDAWGFPVAGLYERTLTALVTDWRRQWGQADLPFIIVQLPNGPAKEDHALPAEPGPWVFVQEAQARLVAQLPDVGCAVIVDTAEADIHPRQKRHAGERAALAARRVAYGEAVAGSGPVYRAMRVEADRLRLSFDPADGGLVARDGLLKGFSLAGEDRLFFWAQGRIEGESVVLWSPDVPKPVAARYLFSEQCPWSLMNRAGLLASPFRTDDWPWDIPARESRALAARAAPAPPVVDGRMDDPAWEDAPVARDLTRVLTYRPAQPTAVRACWDTRNLYLAFECGEREEGRATGMSDAGAKAGDHGQGDFARTITDTLDARFWKGDSIEVLLDPARDRRHYLRFAVNPKGVLFTAKGFNNAVDPDLIHSSLLDGQRWLDKSWKGECTVAATAGEGVWRAELAIPWATLGVSPAAGKTMGAQFLRNHAATGEYGEWATSGRDRGTGAMLPPMYLGGFTQFHSPGRFGTLTLE